MRNEQKSRYILAQPEEMSVSVQENQLGVDESVNAIKRIKLRKSAGYDRVVVGMLRTGEGMGR